MMNIGDWVIVFLILFVLVFFGGEPDVQDVLVKYMIGACQ